MPMTRRRRREYQFWRDAIAAWKESGQSVAAFCAARGIGESTFFAKRRELARRERSPNPPASPTPNTLFAAVRVVPDPTVEIVVPGGIILRVPVAADADAVARLVFALRGAPC
jgi:transposase-like protein